MRTLVFVSFLAATTACMHLPEVPAEKAHELKAPVFIENDFAAALAQAKEKKLPLFVDAWALWCHTCRSMNEFVFNDKELGSIADRYVWLKVDTDKPENAAFVEKYPVNVWPTLLVIDPADERVALRWLGSANVDQLEKLLEDGARVIAAKKAGDTTGADALLTKADQLYGEGNSVEAAKAYREALEQAPSRWSRRGRVVESLLFALSSSDQHEACARAALEEGGSLPRSPSYANAAGTGLFCALEGSKEETWRAEAIRSLEERVREVMSGAPTPLAADDLSGLFMARTLAREEQGDKTGKLALAEEWFAFLERQARRAKGAKERSVFDTHLVSAALTLEKPELALKWLELSERELPEDYNAPARLALLYKAMGKHDQALAAIDRAIPKAYGPRKAKLMMDRADILAARGDKAKAIDALEQSRAHVSTLPAGQQPKWLLTRIETKLTALKE